MAGWVSFGGGEEGSWGRRGVGGGWELGEEGSWGRMGVGGGGDV